MSTFTRAVEKSQNLSFYYNESVLWLKTKEADGIALGKMWTNYKEHKNSVRMNNAKLDSSI